MKPQTTIYAGNVFPLNSEASEPTFRYERFVAERDGRLESTHVTRELSGAVALDESAMHTESYALEEYTLHRNQLGQSGTIRVADGRVYFHLVDGARSRTRIERQKDAVVVGPTLVGHIFRHLDVLRAGSVLRVRMAVLDRLETIGFELRAVDGEPGQTRVRHRFTSRSTARPESSCAWKAACRPRFASAIAGATSTRASNTDTPLRRIADPSMRHMPRTIAKVSPDRSSSSTLSSTLCFHAPDASLNDAE
jgi:hypothetical protein